MMHQREIYMAPNKSILIIDDEFSLRYTLALVLLRAGYMVSTVSSAREALDSLSIDNFDLVLLDLEMPGVNGSTLLTEIRCRYPTLPSLILTAYPGQLSAADEKNGNGDKYLVKPAAPERILTYVNNILGKSNPPDSG